MQVTTTEELIKEAARTVFTRKGLDGARMQDIADEAKVNKALLNYYYRSKEKLFEVVFNEAFTTLYGNTIPILQSNKPLFQKIEDIVSNDYKTISQNPYLPLFVMNEIARNGHLVFDKIHNSPVVSVIKEFSKQVAAEVDKGTIRKISGEELFMNIVSLVMFPFMSQNLFQTIFSKDEPSFHKLIQKRQKDIVTFIIHSIKI